MKKKKTRPLAAFFFSSRCRYSSTEGFPDAHWRFPPLGKTRPPNQSNKLIFSIFYYGTLMAIVSKNNRIKSTLMKRTPAIQCIKKNAAGFLLALFLSLPGFAQYNVTEIITDYNGYWKSGAGAINAVKPGNSHNLLAFSFNGNRYSTGVNDAVLTARNQSFIAGDFRALPVTSVSGAVTSNTKIGLGNMYDGVENGAGTVAPSNNIPRYLTDGIKGLDLGTCVANLPAGTMFLPISKIVAAGINDGVPDVVITQTADPSGSADRYEFTDVNGNRVGNYVDIVLTNIAAAGNWTADFYEASKNPMTLAGGFTKTDRPIRLWTSDLAAFGINSSNAASVAYFKIILSGNSDVAFVAYNNNSIHPDQSLLPVKLSGFSGRQVNDQVQLQWETASESNTASFIAEKSSNGTRFTAMETIAAAGNSGTAMHYSCTDKAPIAGRNYYRLRMVDKDGQFAYSAVRVINCTAGTTGSLQLYPNPAKTYIVINHPFAGGNAQLQIINLQGITVVKQNISPGVLQTKINLPVLPAGIYQLVCTNGEINFTGSIIIQ